MKENEFYYYPCQFEWEAKLSIRTLTPQYISCTIIGNDRCFDVRLGKLDDTCWWICFPILEITTTLSYLNDEFCNIDTLSDLLKSLADGITISCALNKINDLLLLNKVIL